MLIDFVGTPPISDDDIGSIPARNPVELWKHAFCKYFPQNAIRNKPQDDPSKDVQVRVCMTLMHTVRSVSYSNADIDEAMARV